MRAARFLGRWRTRYYFQGLIGEGAKVKDSTVKSRPAGANAIVNKAIIGRKSSVEFGAQLGVNDQLEQEASRWFSGITLIGENLTVTSETKIKRNALLIRL